MAPENEPPAPKGDEDKKFDQADVDRIVQQRLARETAKYSDYDELKKKAEQFDESEAANKTEVDKLRDQVAQLTTERDAAVGRFDRLEIAVTKSLEESDAKRIVSASRRLTGNTRDELEADADEFIEAFPASGGGGTPPPTQKPKPDMKGGGDPTEDPAETDPAKLAESVPRF